MTKKFRKLLIAMVLMCFTLIPLAVKAEQVTHDFSLVFYNCNALDDDTASICVDDNGNPIELTPLADNAMVHAGDLLRMDVHYIPSTTLPTWMLQFSVGYNSSQLTPLLNGTDPYVLELITTRNGGIYPPKGTLGNARNLTNYTVAGNDVSGKSKVKFVVQDLVTAGDSGLLTTEGTLLTMFFTVNDDATEGESLNFTFKPEDAVIENGSQISLHNKSLQVFKVVDTDPSLSNITVTSGSTNYLTSFNSGTKTYDVYVPNSVSSVTVTGTPTKGTTGVLYDPAGGSYSLNVSTTKTVTLFTTAEDSNYTDAYTVNIYRLDNNANLTALSLGSGVTISPDFASSTISYTASVPFSKSSVSVSATKASSKASVSGTGNKNLTAGGVTNVSVTVTPECAGSAYSSVPGNSGTACQTKTYTVEVTRAAASTNNYLSTLTVDGNAVPQWSKTNNGPYSVTIEDGTISSVNIGATVEDTGKATIKSGSKTGTQTIQDGNNQFTITVVPESTTPERTYTVNVYRKSHSTNLSGLTVTSNPQGTLNPSSFNASTKTYTYTVGPDVTSVTITPTSNKNATITANGTSNGNGGYTYNPQTQTTATIHVKSEDTLAEVDYTVNLVRTKSTDTTLDELSVGTYTLSPGYGHNVNSYNVTVPSTVNSVSVTATPHDSRTTATVTGGTNLQTGNNTVTVTVVPENGESSKRTITITVKKLAGNADLTGLTLTNVSYTPTFDKDETSYSKTVPYTTDKTKVNATLSDSKATKTVKLNGTVISENTDVDLVVGTNTITVEVKAEDTNVTKTYTVTVTRTAPSTNNKLSTLKVNNSDVPNWNNTNNGPYNVTVGYDTTKADITATAEDTEFAVVTGDTGENDLQVGDNTFTVTVTPQDPATASRTYTIVVHRQDNNANLGSLTVTSNPQGIMSPTSFSAGTTSYTYTVGPDVTEVTIAATKGKANQTEIVGAGTYNPQTTNKVDIVVKAEDSTKTKTYTVNLARTKSTDTTLDELSVGTYTLSPGYGHNVNSYNVTVPSTVNSVSVTATPHDSRTTATVTGGTNLQTGNNTVTVTVVPENGESSKRTITITVKKLAGNADLTGLTLTNVSYGTFDKDTISYSKTVPFSTNKTKVNATLSDTKATKTVKLNGTVITENTDVDLVVGVNTFTVEVKAEDTNVTKTYTVTVTREAASTNNYLSTLEVVGKDIEFVKTNNGPYDLTVKSNVESVTINATVEDTGKATIKSGSKTGLQQLVEGNNEFNITVVPESTTPERTYTINVYKQNGDTTLGSLTVTANPAGTLSPASYNANTKEYTYTVGPDVTEVTVSATKANDKQKSITGTGTFNPQTVTKTELVVTAEDDSTDTYTVNFVRSESANANLASLGVVGYERLNEDFDANETEYTLTVRSNVPSVTVTATLEDDRATKSGDEVYVFGENENELTATVTVVAEDGHTSKAYHIVITRLSGDATLSELALANVGFGTFASGTTSYTATVPYATNKTKVNATLSDSSASKVVKLNGTVITENTDVDLVVGENIVTVDVTAEDTNVTKTYTVTVTRTAASTNNYLSGLTVDDFELDPEFTSDHSDYDIGTAGAGVDSITITATKADDLAEVTGDIGELDLVDGENVFTITVTPEDPNVDPREYTITVYKQNGNTTLGSLTVTSNPQGTLNPESYSSNVKEYTYTVGPDVTEVTVSATKANDKQKSITGTGTFNPQTVTKTELVVTAEDDSTDTYTVNFVREKSSNADLSALGTVEFDSLNEDFDPNEINYTLTVPSDTEIVTVTATLADDRATKSGDDVYVFGENDTQVTAAVTVTAEDNETIKTYTIVITKQGANADLTGLTLENVDFGTFTSGTISYTATVPYATDKTKVNVTLSDTNATKTVKLNGTTITEDTDVDLVVGANTITVDVVAEDTNVTKTYTVTVTRSEASSNALLSAIHVDDEEIEVESEQFEYSVTVPNTTTSVEVTVDKADSTARVTEGTGTQELEIGDNTVTITVEAEDGTPATYTLTIRRTDTIDTLSNLGITSDPEGSMDKDFTPNETEYTYTISPDTESITVNPIASSDAATITVNGEPVGEDGITLDPNEVDEIVIVVTPEEGEPKTYTVTIAKELDTNNYLSSLTVAEYDINPIFDKNTSGYTLSVDTEVESIIVTAIPEVETSTVEIENATEDGVVSLTEDETVITITVHPQDPEADTREYTLTVTKVDDSEYITSHVYTIADGIIKTVEPETLPEAFKDNLDNENEKLHVFKVTTSGEETTETEIDEENYVGTGMIVKIITNGVLKDFKSILVPGDVTGDGAIELQDVMIVLSNYLGNSQLEGIYFMAANMNNEGEIDLQDVMTVLKMYLGL